MVKTSFDADTGPPMHTQAQRWQPQTVDHFEDPNMLTEPFTGIIWYWTSQESLPRGPRTNTPSGQPQNTSEQEPISFTSVISKGISYQAPDPAEDQITSLESKVAENTQTEQHKNKDCLRDLWDNMSVKTSAS